MDGYDERSYGDAFADVYDDWYADVSDVEATVASLLRLADGAPVLELGVGTGRLAVPLAEAGREAGVAVTGLDTSEAMLARLAERDTAGLVDAQVGDMVGPLPGGPYGLIVVAYNTLFNLPSAEAQTRCFENVAHALRPDGWFVVEAFVPADDADAADDDVSVRTLATDRVVLSVSRRDPAAQRAEGQFIEITEQGGVRLRPWSIRYASIAELDDMATSAGLSLHERWEQFDGTPFTADAERHVSIYRRR